MLVVVLHNTVLGHTREYIRSPHRNLQTLTSTYKTQASPLIPHHILFPMRPLLFLSTRKTPNSNAVMARSQILFYCLMMVVSAVKASVAITGPQGGVDSYSGQRPMRQEFSTFKDSGPAFDLYILSFQQFMEQDQSELLSYYLVAGNSLICYASMCGFVDIKARHSWSSIQILGWGRGSVSIGLLHAQFCLVSLLASTLYGAV